VDTLLASLRDYGERAGNCKCQTQLLAAVGRVLWSRSWAWNGGRERKERRDGNAPLLIGSFGDPGPGVRVAASEAAERCTSAAAGSRLTRTTDEAGFPTL